MSWSETLATAWHAIRSHMLRSLLTVLGILVGVAAVVVTVGLGLGTQKDVSEQISSLGSNLLIVSPGSSTDSSGIRGGFGSSTTLTATDAEALDSDIAAPDVQAVAPEKTSSLSLEANDTNWTTTVTATTTSWPEVRSRDVAVGDFFSDEDYSSSANVVVLGSETADELFGTTNVVGQSVTIDGSTFEIIGVLESAGSSSSTNLDNTAIIPLTTAASTVMGGTTASAVSTIYVKSVSDDVLSAAYQEVESILLNVHGITDADSADFTLESQDALVDTATSIYQTLTVLLAGVAALSARRRYRRDEHHARLRDRAHARDRSAQGARSPSRCDPQPVPARGSRSRPRRRSRRRGPRHRRRLGAPRSHRQLRGRLDPDRLRRTRRRDRHQPHLRRVPGHPSRTSRPHRRSSQRMTQNRQGTRTMTTLHSPRLRSSLVAGASLLVAGLALAGCASASATPEPSSTADSTDAGAAQPQTPSGVSGLIAYAEDGLLQVQSSDEQTAVRYTDSTTVTKQVSVDVSTIAVGSCVMIVTGDDETTATSITVSDAADDGTCSVGGGGGFPGGGGDSSGQMPSGDGARPSGMPTDMPSDMPTDAPDGSSDAQGGPGGMSGGFGNVVSGAVTAVGDGTLTVESTGFGDDAQTTSADVTVTSDTTATGTAAATTADIATGLCVTAMGEADDAGGYDATSLALSDPDSNGDCNSGFGGFPGRGSDASGQGDGQ